MRLLRALVQPFRGSSPGATVTEYMVVTGFVALFCILAFNRFGRTLHRAYQEEARHVSGQGAPGAVDLLGAIGGLTDPSGVCNLATGVCIGGCFVAGTPVATERGDRPIETIVPGDRVLARDPETGAVALRTVVRTYIRRETPVITLDLHDGAFSAERIRVTASHRFWVEGNGWVPAGELAATPLWSTDTSVVASVVESPPEITTVYNLEVEGFHTYFVGHSRALVHNQTQQPGPNNCNAQNPGVVPGTGGAGSGTRPPFTEAQVDECLRAMRQKNGPMLTHTQTITRPADAGERICNDMLAECANAANKPACLKKWECIDAHIADHPSSGYFGNQSTRERIQRQCSNSSEITKSCYKGGGTRNVPIPPAIQNEINQAARDRRDAQLAGNQQGMIEASERAGDAAARGYTAPLEQQGYDCTSMSGARVFDRVCVGPGGEVVIVEAKGGSSTLGDRWDATGTKRVQQGTKEYIDAVVADMRNSGDPDKVRIARQVADAFADGNDVNYHQVNQKFDSAGRPATPTTQEFELDRSKCP